MQSVQLALPMYVCTAHGLQMPHASSTHGGMLGGKRGGMGGGDDGGDGGAEGEGGGTLGGKGGGSAGGGRRGWSGGGGLSPKLEISNFQLSSVTRFLSHV